MDMTTIDTDKLKLLLNIVETSRAVNLETLVRAYQKFKGWNGKYQ